MGKPLKEAIPLQKDRILTQEQIRILELEQKVLFLIDRIKSQEEEIIPLIHRTE